MKKILYIIFTCLLLVSCDKKPQDILLGECELQIVLEGVDSDTVKLLYPAPKTISFRIVSGDVLPDKNIVASIAADTSLVDAYNKSHGTSYSAASVDILNLTRGQVVIPKFNDKSSTGSFSIESQVMTGNDSCLLPLVIKGISGKSDVVCKPLYLICEKYNLPEQQNIGKSDWKMIYFTSEKGENYSGHKYVREDNPSSSMTGYAVDLIDGSYSSIWAYDSNGAMAPFYFVIDLGKFYTIRSMNIYAQRGDKDMSNPANMTPNRQCGQATVEFATTLSGYGMADQGGTGEADWSGREDFSNDVLRNQICNTVNFSNLHYARYIRFVYHKGYKNTSETVPSYTGGALAELDIFGYDEKIEM